MILIGKCRDFICGQYLGCVLSEMKATGRLSQPAECEALGRSSCHGLCLEAAARGLCIVVSLCGSLLPIGIALRVRGSVRTRLRSARESQRALPRGHGRK
jgi:hypothetical protein